MELGASTLVHLGGETAKFIAEQVVKEQLFPFLEQHYEGWIREVLTEATGLPFPPIPDRQPLPFGGDTRDVAAWLVTLGGFAVGAPMPPILVREGLELARRTMVGWRRSGGLFVPEAVAPPRPIVMPVPSRRVYDSPQVCIPPFSRVTRDLYSTIL